MRGALSTGCEVALFAEDRAHQIVVGGLLRRIAEAQGTPVRITTRTATGGFGTVKTNLTRYIQDLGRDLQPRPDLIVVATDANCRGARQRIEDLGRQEVSSPLVHAIPDPHIERWLLLDGAAFKSVFGKGCNAPDQKCERNRYKQLLAEAIRGAGRAAPLGGIEYARDLVEALDLKRARRADASLARFADEAEKALRG